jgi:hypothetical protein
MPFAEFLDTFIGHGLGQGGDARDSATAGVQRSPPPPPPPVSNRLTAHCLALQRVPAQPLSFHQLSQPMAAG